MSIGVHWYLNSMTLYSVSLTHKWALRDNTDVFVDNPCSEWLLRAKTTWWLRCDVFIYSDLGATGDKSHREKWFQNVQSRVKRVVATRVTCVYIGFFLIDIGDWRQRKKDEGAYASAWRRDSLFCFDNTKFIFSQCVRRKVSRYKNGLPTHVLQCSRIRAVALSLFSLFFVKIKRAVYVF